MALGKQKLKQDISKVMRSILQLLFAKIPLPKFILVPLEMCILRFTTPYIIKFCMKANLAYKSVEGARLYSKIQEKKKDVKTKEEFEKWRNQSM